MTGNATRKGDISGYLETLDWMVSATLKRKFDTQMVIEIEEFDIQIISILYDRYHYSKG